MQGYKRINRKEIDRILKHINTVMPGFSYFIEQFTKINYNKSFWWDVLSKDFIEAYRILLEYYSYREEEVHFVLYEILRPLLNNNIRLISEILNSLKNRDYRRAIEIIKNTTRLYI